MARKQTGAAQVVRRHGRSTEFLDVIETPVDADVAAKQDELSMILAVLIDRYDELRAPQIEDAIAREIDGCMRYPDVWLRATITSPLLRVDAHKPFCDELGASYPELVKRAAHLLDVLPVGPVRVVRGRIIPVRENEVVPNGYELVGGEFVETDASLVVRDILGGENTQRQFQDLVLPAVVQKVLEADPGTTLPEMIDIAKRSSGLVLYPSRGGRTGLQLGKFMDALTRTIADEGKASLTKNEGVPDPVLLENFVYDRKARRVQYRKLPEDFAVPVADDVYEAMEDQKSKRLGDFVANSRGVVDGQGCPARFATEMGGEGVIQRNWDELIDRTARLWALALPAHRFETDDEALKAALGSNFGYKIDIADVPDVLVRVVQGVKQLGVSIDGSPETLGLVEIAVTGERTLSVRPSVKTNADTELACLTVRLPYVLSVEAVNCKQLEINGAHHVALDVPTGGMARVACNDADVVARPGSTVLLRTDGKTNLQLESGSRALVLTSANRDRVQVNGDGQLNFARLSWDGVSLSPFTVEADLVRLMLSDEVWMNSRFFTIPGVLAELMENLAISGSEQARALERLTTPTGPLQPVFQEEALSFEF